ncbi:MAG: hypothetical protein ACQCN3_02710 [Candidatus Bathyarchaeia archaeon]
MRECPECGYKDPPYWRNVRFRIFTSCCGIDDFAILFPKLAKRIVTEINIAHKNYIYHYVKKAKMVQRIHIDDSLDGKSWREPEQEKHLCRFGHGKEQQLLVISSNDVKLTEKP